MGFVRSVCCCCCCCSPAVRPHPDPPSLSVLPPRPRRFVPDLSWGLFSDAGSRNPILSRLILSYSFASAVHLATSLPLPSTSHCDQTDSINYNCLGAQRLTVTHLLEFRLSGLCELLLHNIYSFKDIHLLYPLVPHAALRDFQATARPSIRNNLSLRIQYCTGHTVELSWRGYSRGCMIGC